MVLFSVFGGFGEVFVGIVLFFFVFIIIFVYYYIVEINVVYLNCYFKGNILLVVVKFVIMFMVVYGMVNSLGYIWNIGDIGVGLMVWINIVGILVIFFVVKFVFNCL